MAYTFYKDSVVQAPAGADDKAKLTTVFNGCNDGGTHTIELAPGVSDELIDVGSSANSCWQPGVINADVTIKTRNLESIHPQRKTINNVKRDSIISSLAGFTTAGVQSANLFIPTGVNNLHFEGIRFNQTYAGLFTYHMVLVGTQDVGATQPTTRVGLPNNITFDRCIAKPPSGTRPNSGRRAFYVHGTNIKWDYCNISGFYQLNTDVVSGQNDYGTIWLGAVDGVEINKTYCESGGETIFAGITNLMPKNVKIQHSYLTLDNTLLATVANKNRFECKNIDGLLMIGNIIENHYANLQGYALMFNLRSEGNPGIENRLRNIHVAYNIIRNSGGVFSTPGYDGDNGASSKNWGNGPIENFYFGHNYCYGISNTYGTWNGATASALYAGINYMIDHNMFWSDKDAILHFFDNKGVGYYTPAGDFVSVPRATLLEYFRYTNNIWKSTTYGFRTTNSTPDVQGAAAINISCAPNKVFRKNVGHDPFSTWTGYTGSNNFVADATAHAANFKDPDNGDGRLIPGSSYAGYCDDGSNPGPNWEQLKAEVPREFWDLPW